MANQWGSNSLAPGSAAGWYFNRANERSFLPYISVIPTTPSFTQAQWSKANDGYPSMDQLGISTQWASLSSDESTLQYYIVVENNSNHYVEYSFVEADF
jgi:hypothetical protein